MDWLLGCFKCGQRRGCSIDSPESRKDQRETLVAAGLLGANSAEKGGILYDGNSNFQGESFEMGKVLTMPGDGSARTSSGSIKIERRRCPRSGHSSEQLLLVEKLEEEINDLNKKLVEEASQARILTNEVRHLRQCSELLDSTDTFKRALDVLEDASHEGDGEESRPLRYLQSMLSQIGTTEETLETLSGEKTDARASEGSEEESISLSSCFEEQSLTERENLALDSAQRNFSDVAIEEGPKLREEHTASISVCQPSFESVSVDANKPPLVSTLKRRRPSTFSFSGFIVFEDEPEASTSLEHHSISTEMSVSKIIETHDTSSENLVEASNCLFAFATSSSQSHSISTEHSLPHKGSEAFSFLSSDSEVESCLKTAQVEGGHFILQESPRCLQDDNMQGSHRMCSDFIVEQSQSETSENGYEDCSDVSSHIYSSRTSSRCSTNDEPSTSYGFEVLQLHLPSIEEDKESLKRHANFCTDASQSVDMNDAISRNTCFTEDNNVAPASDSEAKHGFKPLLEGGVRIKSSERVLQGEATLLKEELLRSSRTASSEQAELLDKNKYCNRVTPCIGSLLSLSQDDFSTIVGDSTVEISTGGAPSISSPSTDTSPYSIHTLSPSTQVGQEGNRCSSESPATPLSVNSRASVVPLSKDDPSQAQYSPLRTPLASLSHAETPNSLHSQGSPTNMGEDRPILGTVAAHWNPSSSSAKKWWDGKGIPNSTNKYKEDQKVSWHATPFEVRLERALAKQGRVFQKKLFTGAMATEMEVSI